MLALFSFVLLFQCHINESHGFPRMSPSLKSFDCNTVDICGFSNISLLRFWLYISLLVHTPLLISWQAGLLFYYFVFFFKAFEFDVGHSMKFHSL